MILTIGLDTNMDTLIHILEELSPMPSDDSPQLTEERLFKYNEVTIQIYNIIDNSDAGSRDPRFIKPLIRSFGYGDAYESYWPVLHALEKYPLEILRPALIEAIETGEPGARMWCVYMLGCQRNPEDTTILISALKDKKPKVRFNALVALAMLGNLSAKPAMEALLEDPDEEVRKKAVECINALIDKRWVIKK